jgi:hypothetical protein
VRRARLIRPVRGLGQGLFSAGASLPSSVPDISQALPGNLSSQLTQGQNLFGAIQNAVGGVASGSGINPQMAAMLLNQGVTVSDQLTQQGGAVGNFVRDVMTIGAAAAAGACAGGVGAAVGAIAAALEIAIQGLFGGGPQNQIAYNPVSPTGGGSEPTSGAKRIYQFVQQWCQMPANAGLFSGNPFGWTYYDYISRKYPPSSTPPSQQSQLWSLVEANINRAAQSTSNPNQPYTLGIVDEAGSILASGTNFTSNFAVNYFLANYYEYGPCSTSSYDPFEASCVVPGTLDWSNPSSTYMKVVQPVGTPILWWWAQPNGSGSGGASPGDGIVDVMHNEWFGTSNQDDDDRYYDWQQDTTPIQGRDGRTISASDIMSYAIANRPSPMFYASDLYVTQASGPNELFGNCAAMSGVAMVCGLLAAGGSCQSIVSELLMEQNFLQHMDGGVPPLFRALVEEYIAKAAIERALASSGVPAGPSSFWSTPGGEAAAVALGALGAGAVGVLGYSAYMRQSPLVVLENIGSRIRSKI